MRDLMRHHLGKVVAGAAIAVAGTAAMAAVTLPGEAGAETGREAGAAAPGPQPEGGGALGTDRAGPGTVEAAPEQGERGIGRDPLTGDETERARRIALDRGLRTGSEDVRGRTGPQPLTVDLVEPSPEEAALADPPRRARVTYYDYRDDTYVTRTVGLASGRVESTDTQRGVQPPPTRREAAEAARLLLASPLGDGLEKDYRDATGKALTGVDRLTVTGYVYRGDQEGPAPDGLAECGRHRCVRLFTKVRNGPWIDTRHLVIDLSARTVGRLG